MAQRQRKAAPRDPLNYKPVLLKWPILALLGLYICCLIALLEYGCRRFPSSHDRRAVPNAWNVTATQTAVLSIPLVNRRGTPTTRPRATGLQSVSTTPIRTPTQSPPSRGPNRDYLRFRRVNNDTVTPLLPESNSTNTNNTLPRTFAERVGYSPYYLNHSRENPSPGHRRRAPGPTHFGQLSGPTQLVTVYLGWWPHINQAYSEIVYFPPVAWNALLAGDDGGPESLHPCWITCDGPAIIFHDTVCWDIWSRLSATEKDARNTPGMVWRVREIENSAQKCQALRQTPSGVLTLATNTWEAEVTDPVNGHVSTSTWLETISNRIFKTSTSEIAEVPVVSGFVALTDSKGVPTSTSTMVGSDWIRVSKVLVTVVDDHGRPLMTNLVVPSDITVTLTGAAQVLTGTSIAPSPTKDAAANAASVYNPFVTTLTLTGKDTNGVPISTWTTTRPVSGIITVTDSLGAPIATVTYSQEFGSPGETKSDLPPSVNASDSNISPPHGASFHPVTRREYYIISFLPVFLAICLSIVAQMISSSIRVFLPYHLLTRPGGVSVEDSLAMSTGGIYGYFNSIRLLFKFSESMSFLGDLLVIVSAIVTSLSSEAVGIKLHGSCAPDSFQGCYMGIAVFKEPSRALIGLLSVVLAALVLIGFLLPKWRTGVAFDPRSIAATASLIQDPGLRKLFRERLRIGEGWTDHPRFLRQREIIQKLNGQLFCLRYFRNPDRGGAVDYGITIVPQNSLSKIPTTSTTRLANTNTRLSNPNPKSPTTSLAKAKSWAIQSITSIKVTRRRATRRRLWLDELTNQPTADRIVNVAGGLLMLGLIILTSSYYLTSRDSKFERFMNSQGFGVEMVFTTLGVVLSFFWDYRYSQTTTLRPYRSLSLSLALPLNNLNKKTHKTLNPLHQAPPLTPLTGLPLSVLRFDLHPSIMGLAAILSKFTPTLLSNIPFSPAQTWSTHLVCGWGSVAILGLMVVVVVAGAVVERGSGLYLPVDLGAGGGLVGRIWYLCWGEGECDGKGYGVVGDFAGRSVDGLGMGSRMRRSDGGCGTTELGLKGGRYVFGEVLGPGPGGQGSLKLKSGSGREVRVGIWKCEERVGVEGLNKAIVDRTRFKGESSSEMERGSTSGSSERRGVEDGSPARPGPGASPDAVP